MPKEHINPNSLFPSVPHGFSQVVVASGEKMVFVSGQTAWDIRKNIIGGDNLLEQARQALRNVQAAIEATGGTLEDIVSLRIYIVNYQSEHAEAVSVALKNSFLRQIHRQVPGSASQPWPFRNF
jgi:2-iminobutanoate/2-iminopropanoate deaminase